MAVKIEIRSEPSPRGVVEALRVISFDTIRLFASIVKEHLAKEHEYCLNMGNSLRTQLNCLFPQGETLEQAERRRQIFLDQQFQAGSRKFGSLRFETYQQQLWGQAEQIIDRLHQIWSDKDLDRTPPSILLELFIFIARKSEKKRGLSEAGLERILWEFLEDNAYDEVQIRLILSVPVLPVDWEVLPAQWWRDPELFRRVVRHANPADSLLMLERIEWLDTFGPLEWRCGPEVLSRMYFIALFPRYAMAENIRGSNALFVLDRSHGNWRVVFRGDKREAIALGAHRIIHDRYGAWRRKVADLLKEETP